MKKETKPIKGIRISRMNAAIIAISLVLYLCLSVTAFCVSRTVQDGYHAMEEYFTCMQIGEFFSDGSDYLREQARSYVSTGNRTYMEKYFSELHTERSRENAIEMLKFSSFYADISKPIHAAMEKSDTLVEREVYAMALASLAQGREIDSLGPELQNAPLTAQDRALSGNQLLAKAKEQIFSSDYQNIEEQISIDIEKFFYVLGEKYNQYMNTKYAHLHGAVVIHQGLIAVHFAATIMIFVTILLLVLIPLGRGVKNVQEGKPLRVFGSYEYRRLAWAYNGMLARILANENALRRQAEHDALTGLLNRGAFEALQTSLENCGRPLALLLVDVDKFKQINDGYGHEIGDQVLKKVAGLLAGHFRSTDYPIRVGGDEFAVIVMDAGIEEQEKVASKITAINEILTHPDDGLPVVSLSVGGAFSGDGFTESLYRSADAALYEVKEQGRCGCRFYASEPSCIPSDSTTESLAE